MADSTPTTPREQMIRGVSVSAPSQPGGNNVTLYTALPSW